MRVRLFIAVLLSALVPTTQLVAQGPELRVLSPIAGETVTGDTVSISFETPGLTIMPSTIKVEEAGKHPEVNRPGQGHLHFMLDLQPMVVWDKAEPYVFTDVPPGDHLLTIEIVQNDHSSFVPPLTEQIRFTSVEAPQASQASQAPQAASLTPTTLPNTGFDDVGSYISRYLLIALGGFFVLVGGGIRRQERSR